jgi:hypothetical protein
MSYTVSCNSIKEVIPMADFARTVRNHAVPVLINLDYVIEIDRGLDPQEPTIVRFINGDTIQLTRAEGTELVRQLNRCCIEREKEGESPGGDSGTPGGSPSEQPKPKDNQGRGKS